MPVTGQGGFIQQYLTPIAAPPAFTPRQNMIAGLHGVVFVNQTQALQTVQAPGIMNNES